MQLIVGPCGRDARRLAELEPTVRSIARILKPGGWFVASIVHPCDKTPADGEMIDHVAGAGG